MLQVEGVKSAANGALKEVKRTAASELASANAAVAAITTASKQAKAAFKAQVKEQRHSLHRAETSLQQMGAELLAKESKILEVVPTTTLSNCLRGAGALWLPNRITVEAHARARVRVRTPV